MKFIGYTKSVLERIPVQMLFKLLWCLLTFELWFPGWWALMIKNVTDWQNYEKIKPITKKNKLFVQKQYTLSLSFKFLKFFFYLP